MDLRYCTTFFITLFLFMKITIIADIRHVGHDDEISLKLRAMFGLLKYTYKIPLIKVDPDGPNLLLKKKKQSARIKSLRTVTKKFLLMIC